MTALRTVGSRTKKATAQSPGTPAGQRAWVGVVSLAHVQRGGAGGFAQLCHGKSTPLARMGTGDWLVYYSPSTDFRGGERLRAFTAIGRVIGDDIYSFDMGGGFLPDRRDIAYCPGARQVPVASLADRLCFIRENPHWGMLARRGHFEIGLDDLRVIAQAMEVAEAVSAR